MSQTAPVVEAQSASALPDVNAETYPYDFVQLLLDQSADFSLCAVPESGFATSSAATLTPRSPDDYFGLNGGYGIAIGSALHRFDAVVQPPADGSVRVAQTVGEAVGRLRCRWLFGPDSFAWKPGQEPPPVIFDPWRAQRFALLDAVFALGDGHGFSGYGVGRTFPSVVGGDLQILVGVVGNVTAGQGSFAGLEGTFVLTGTLTDELGFAGSVTCRMVDFAGRLRAATDLPSHAPIADPDPGNTFFVLRGEKKDRTVKTVFGPPPDAERLSLITPSQMRAMRYACSSRGDSGPRTRSAVHQVVGPMDATVFFNLLAPPGTAERPVPFTTQEVYSVLDGDGRELGTLECGVVEGISFALSFPAAPGQKGVRFAGFGPITGGTGAFAGAQGMLTVNSLIGIAPHALSLLHVLHLVDPSGAWRADPGTPARRPVAQRMELAPDDPYALHLRHKEERTATYLRWRDGFSRCAAQLAPAIAETFNNLMHRGEFPGLRIDPWALQTIFEKRVGPFDPETFDRYQGRAKGVFRTYDLASGKEVGTSVLYSWWNHENYELAERRIAKKISGSFAGYFDPLHPPPLAEGKVDTILNSYRPDVGLTSWVEISQGGPRQRTSFAYKLPAPHEILWFVKDVSLGGKPVEDNVFMASHEWKGFHGGKVAYLMVAVFFDVDFERCSLRLSGDQYWRALYEEE